MYFLIGGFVGFLPCDQPSSQAHARLHEAIELVALVDLGVEILEIRCYCYVVSKMLLFSPQTLGK